MKIIQHIKNIFAKTNQLPKGFARDAEYDVVFLYDVFNGMPLITKADNGRKYMFFQEMSKEQLNIVRKMGFKPKHHINYFEGHNAEYLYRAPITLNLSTDALKMVAKIESYYHATNRYFSRYVKNCKQDSRYQKYVQAYADKTK